MFPVLIHIPNLPVLGDFYIATYGMLVAASYLGGILWLKSRAGEMALDEERFWRLIYYLFFGAIAGGKLLFVLLNWQAFASGQMGLLRDFRFGFVYFGGFVGVVVMGFVFCRGSYGEFIRRADYFTSILPVGHALGRLGCFAAGCCYGRPTDIPWAVRFTDQRSLVPPSLLGTHLHPTQLYEALGNLAIAAVLFRLLKRVKEGGLKAGAVFYSYILMYSVLRFVVEIYRGDDRGAFVAGLSPSQWISIVAAAMAIVTARQAGLWRKS